MIRPLSCVAVLFAFSAAAAEPERVDALNNRKSAGGQERLRRSTRGSVCGLLRAVHNESAPQARGIPKTMTTKRARNVVGDQDQMIVADLEFHAVVRVAGYMLGRDQSNRDTGICFRPALSVGAG